MTIMCRFIRPDDVPVQYGGLSRPNDEFKDSETAASEFTVKAGEKVNIEIEGIEVDRVLVLCIKNLVLFNWFVCL